MWFDMWIHHSRTIVTKEQLLQLKNLIRELQPNCLVNSRLGLSVEEDSDVDYRTLGDNQLGSNKLEYPGQSPGTVAHSWGYHAGDTQWKSTTALLKALIGNVSLNGNYMLNIGPRANGDVPYEISQRMLDMGAWMDVNGEAIYGAEAFDLDKDQHDWGKITYKATAERTHRLYLHVYNWPINGRLPITGVITNPQKAYVLRDKLKSPLNLNHNDIFTEISLPKDQPDPLISVVVLEYDQKPVAVDGFVAKTVDGGFSLKYENKLSEEVSAISKGSDHRGTVPPHLIVNGKYQSSWKIFVDQAGAMDVDVSYSCQAKNPKGKIRVIAAKQSLAHEVQHTGLTVGEPNRDWHIDDFPSNRIGTINFPEPGIYEIYMELESGRGEELKFQWLWLKDN
jgi:alpha-L-fucosidase